MVYIYKITNMRINVCKEFRGSRTHIIICVVSNTYDMANFRHCYVYCFNSVLFRY